MSTIDDENSLLIRKTLKSLLQKECCSTSLLLDFWGLSTIFPRFVSVKGEEPFHSLPVAREYWTTNNALRSRNGLF